MDKKQALRKILFGIDPVPFRTLSSVQKVKEELCLI
jgi:hypothetical protein